MIEKLKSNIQRVRERIAAAAEKSGRSVSDIRLVAVTKYIDVQMTALVVEAGCHEIGESRPQVLLEKFDALSGDKSPGLTIQWHLIGHLQRNKAARTVSCASLIHSVDSQRLLTAIDGAATAIGKIQPVLLEINVSGETAKHGFTADQLPEAIEWARSLAGIRVDGLMCMAGLSGTAEETRREFESLRQLSERHRDLGGVNISLDELSMGMSGDFEAAIEQGATIVRIGSVLFEGV